jgi:hypothetical protein
MVQYRLRPIFSVVPHERHRFGSFPSATGTGNAFMAFFILPSAAVALSALTGEKIAGTPYHRIQKKGKRDDLVKSLKSLENGTAS